MKILFLHGWHSVPGGVKPTYLKDHGHEVINPALNDKDFDAAVATAQAEFDKHQPQVVVGSSRGGAVAMNINSGNAKLVLLCPAWKNWGTATTVRPDTTVLHSRADNVIPFADSEELTRNSGARLIEVGKDHRLADPESLAAMLRECQATNSSVTSESGDKFISMILRQVVPWIEKATIPFFHLRKNPKTNEYEDGIIDKDRSGVFLKVAGQHFVLTASHNIPEMVKERIYLFMSWDTEEHCPIPIANEEIAVSDESTIDIGIIKLREETTSKLLQRHTPITISDIAIDCKSSDGVFLIVGYPRAGTEFTEQKWDEPHPHPIKTESLKFISTRKYSFWEHDKLKYSPHMHIVLGMTRNSVSATSGESETLPEHKGIQGISGCGIWFVADRKKNLPLADFTLEHCRLVAIEHSYDEEKCKVAGTWIDVALLFLANSFPETREAILSSKIRFPHNTGE